MKRSFQAVNQTFVAIADTTTLINAQFMGLGLPVTTNQMLTTTEIMLSGFATSSIPAFMQYARDSTAVATPTALAAPNSDGPLNTYASATTTVANAFVAATTNPSRSAVTTAARLNLGFNAFGGIVRWVAAPGYEFQLLSAATIADSSLSNFTGGGSPAVSAHIIYELV